MHLKPTAGCQISTFIFGFEGGALCISHEKLQKDGKVLCHLGFNSEVLPGPFYLINSIILFYLFIFKVCI
jgi:hypothetical protein